MKILAENLTSKETLYFDVIGHIPLRKATLLKEILFTNGIYHKLQIQIWF